MPILPTKWHSFFYSSGITFFWRNAHHVYHSGKVLGHVCFIIKHSFKKFNESNFPYSVFLKKVVIKCTTEAAYKQSVSFLKKDQFHSKYDMTSFLGLFTFDSNHPRKLNIVYNGLYMTFLLSGSIHCLIFYSHLLSTISDPQFNTSNYPDCFYPYHKSDFYTQFLLVF